MFSIGQGYDIHNLSKNKNHPLVLGGFCFLDNYQIEAISDGDLVLHAISDAILGSIQAGDIGLYFPDTNLENKNLDSKKILAFCLKKLAEKKGKIVNLDITIICEKIILAPYRNEIIASLQKLLNIKTINLKATRFENKKNYQIACNAILLIQQEELC